MKYKLILIVIIILAICGVFLAYSQNIDNSSEIESINQNISSNTVDDLVNNSSSTNSSIDAENSTAVKDSTVATDLGTKTKIRNESKNNESTTKTPFKIPKGTKLSYAEAQKLANEDLAYKNTYAKVVDCSKIGGEYYWNFLIYDKKTGKVLDGAVIEDRTGNCYKM
ncbi:hypothetical protein [Methanobrevibacter filiformis]|uniref:Uncharacterized protein n=1 Tax=Methanobrevibacter filiformis TaxID=55758 RepID=A0A165ZRE7_9EURY|nr:hypothetical protein [Methanobrevibacter filiformis]KZX11066.1 hypothetical protein MBFIL_15370 [Methanobrevibacter filiformis]